MVAAPPYAVKNASGAWEGFSIDLWQAVAAEMGVPYDLQEQHTFEQLVHAVANGQLDVAIGLAATEQREAIIDLSHPYYRSGLAIAVPRDSVGRGWTGFLGGIETAGIFKAVGLLVLFWLIAGAAVLASIGLIAGLTATISASLTAEKLTGKVRGLRDLPHVRVGSVTQSEPARWLVDHGITPTSFQTEQVGLKAVVDDRIDAFVFDEIALKYAVKKDFPGRVHVLSETFDHYFVCIGLPIGSSLRKPINAALLQLMETKQWNRIVERYIGPEG